MSWRARFTPCVASLTVWLNPKDPNCFGVRNWWRNNLPELQLLNPFCSFTIQELSFGEPHMYINYTPTDQRMIRLAGATEDECEDIMEACITYGMNHAIIERPRTDDGGDLSTSQPSHRSGIRRVSCPSWKFPLLRILVSVHRRELTTPDRNLAYTPEMSVLK
ncbi:hypothetical protein, conserved [Trypanosoma brucei gambiense DAL972]|uniref:NADH dehydrogenase subunit NI8M n=1 Tax=Trypanosoma brucei gambiense (strain MHOM/CI/86/DAL972) TaxID=679716 RepID=D0AAT1_TRYB9|nr:hypothetical protein, conserved [Trypanosoma brucei gambiense DAL972]CBH18782.1 hypothetical protein, conserved [Trypanosoma brucei gambiense DAL972]|eukprot:XP_011781046.1 hypothetical protein, conserved [Trypanosoma brucei gambiense DAL972]